MIYRSPLNPPKGFFKKEPHPLKESFGLRGENQTINAQPMIRHYKGK
jgi:hypothetical protein